MLGEGSAATATATAMWGLAGFVLLAVSEYAGELEQAVESLESVVGCPGDAGCRPDCMTGSRRGCGTARRWPAEVLVWAKRVWRCVERRHRGQDRRRGIAGFVPLTKVTPLR